MKKADIKRKTTDFFETITDYSPILICKEINLFSMKIFENNFYIKVF